MPGFDYIVVGAGSAGCVLANRLSADPAVRVLLIEAGGPDTSWNVRIPARILHLVGKPNRHNWFRFTEPQAHLENRRMYWPAGRGWGGTSSINGMAYMRGQPQDYDCWQQMGLAGWSYADLLAYFKRAENNARGAGAFHGVGGPMHVWNAPVQLPLSRTFIEAGVAAGYPRIDDFNGAETEGFGPIQMTVHKGRRWNTASAYLRPALHRPNLTVESHALVTRVLFQGMRATGVAVVRGRKRFEVTADREVILSGGTAASPQMLLLSGVGDAEALRRLDIPVVADRPEVGRNLQDHVSVQILSTCSRPVSLYTASRSLGAVRTGLQYFLLGTGPAGGIGVDTYAAVRSGPKVDQSDIHIAFINALMEGLAIKRHGFTLNLWHLRPDSRGTITLRSRDPAEHPTIQPNYLSRPREAIALREAVKIARDVLAQAAFDPYRGKELAPGPHVRTDAEIDAFIRRTATGLYHPVGTCRMGTDEAAVVDGSLRVNGVHGLRVVDASVMPNITSGNTNAPTIAIAEKAADLILGRSPPPPDYAFHTPQEDRRHDGTAPLKQMETR